MGYRSDGCIIATGSAGLTVMTKYRLLHPDHYTIFQEDNAIPQNPENVFFRLEYDSWKWYDNYPGVQVYEQFWSFLEDEADNQPADYLSAVYLRIGEDIEDNIERYINDGWYLARITRAIDTTV